MSFLSVEMLNRYAQLLEERVRLLQLEKTLRQEAMADFRIRTAMETWAEDSHVQNIVQRLDRRLADRLDARSGLDDQIRVNKRARKQWHQDVLTYIESIISN